MSEDSPQTPDSTQQLETDPDIQMIAAYGTAGQPETYYWVWNEQRFDSEAAARAACQLAADEQEALSVRYAQGLQLVALSSGRWAIFGMDRKLVEICQTLDPERLRELSHLSATVWEARRQAERDYVARLGERDQMAKVQAEEMGL